MAYLGHVFTGRHLAGLPVAPHLDDAQAADGGDVVVEVGGVVVGGSGCGAGGGVSDGEGVIFLGRGAAVAV